MTALLVACGPNVDADDDDTAGTSGPGSDTGSGPSTTSAGPGSTTTTGADDTTGVLDTTADTTTAGPLDLEDTYLLAVSPSLSPQTPLQFRAVVTAKGDELFLGAQPLSLDVGSTTEPREVLPEPMIVLMTDLGPDGSFVLEFGEQQIPGQANPITGSDIVATMELTGSFTDPTFACGTADGEVFAPIQASLLGSTFAMHRLEDPNTFPEEFLWACP
jgi:hypothetical protein